MITRETHSVQELSELELVDLSYVVWPSAASGCIMGNQFFGGVKTRPALSKRWFQTIRTKKGVDLLIFFVNGPSAGISYMTSSILFKSVIHGCSILSLPGFSGVFEMQSP